ncbi:hypothetical protein KR018_004383 [Drosophila ironensis]|nr:hypothetical protein KR018_004383 [Drosophila ironensis]
MRIAPQSPSAFGHIFRFLCHLLIISAAIAIYPRCRLETNQQSGMENCDDMDMGMGMGRAVQCSNSKATIIAEKAADDARLASESQQPAALAAAHQVRTQLADKANQAAKAAQAALAGKQEIVEQLQDEVHEAEIVLREETDSVIGSRANLNAANTSAKQAKLLIETLQSTIRVAQEALCNAQAAASGAKQEYLKKTQLAEAARNRAEILCRHLRNAKLDYISTQKAAYSAACAASEARHKADRNRRSQSLASSAQDWSLSEPQQSGHNEQGAAIFSK